MENPTYKQIYFFKNLLELIIVWRAEKFPPPDLPDRTGLFKQMQEYCGEFQKSLEEELLGPVESMEQKKKLMDMYVQLQQILSGGWVLLEMKSPQSEADLVLQAVVGHVSEMMNSILEKLECPIPGSSKYPDLADDREHIADLFEKTKPFWTGDLHMGLMGERIKEYIIGTDLRFFPGKDAGQYFLKVLSSVGGWDWSEDLAHPFSPSGRFLFYMNYNSKAFMDDLVRCIQHKVSEQPTWDAKFVVLLDCRKKMLQMHFRKDAVLNPAYQGVREYLESWFDAEIFYLENAGVLVEGNKPRPVRTEVNPANKLMCNLSADQLSILLRAMDEIRLVEARSLSQVYRMIVPYLSTKNRKHLSADSLRVKSYQVERSDREQVLEVLDRIASKVSAL